MRIRFKEYIIMCLLVFSSMNMFGQNASTYHLSTLNGLPTNKVYGVIVDKFGYLWMGTEKGVVRYNGYNYRMFNHKDGLPKDDVWQVFEDRKGRVWTITLSDEIGYIYNNKYTGYVLGKNSNTVYPRNLSRYGDGIIFNSHFLNSSPHPSICIFDSDSFTIIQPPDSICPREFHNVDTEIMHCYVFPDNRICYSLNRKFYCGTIKNNKFSIYKSFHVDDTVFCNSAYFPGEEISRDIFGHNIIASYKNGHKTLRKALNIDNEAIIDSYFYCISRNNKNYFNTYLNFKQNEYNWCICSKINLYHCDDYNGILKIKSSIDISSVTKKISPPLPLLYYDSLWKLYGLSKKVLFLINPYGRFFQDANNNLRNSKCVGCIGDSLCFWWDEKKSCLIRRDWQMNQKIIFNNVFKDIKKIVPINSNCDTFFVIGNNNKCAYLFNDKIFNFNRRDFVSKDIVFETSGKLYYINYNGFYSSPNLRNLYSETKMDDDRYIGVLKDTTLGSYFAYTQNKIYYKTKVKSRIISREFLIKNKIKNIETLQIDNLYGNIFVKTAEGLFVFDNISDSIKEILSNRNIENSKLIVYKEKLLIIGNFGVSCSKIMGKGIISKPIVYKNIGKGLYSDFFEAQIAYGKIFISTDKGNYWVDIPTDHELAQNDSFAEQDNYKFLVYYKDTIVDITKNDTITLDQKKLLLRFDLINPEGIGQVTYSYSVAGEEGTLNDNELTLPGILKPGIFYKMVLKANDDAWRSDDIVIIVYIKPTLWQTILISPFFTPALILLILGLLGIVAFVTRRLVMQSNLRKNFIKDIELKSVYSQINPHFIFNSLNTALYFIKKGKTEEAYDNVSKFSKLLRAYITSSRNKYIAVADEVDNLKNYIQLQLSRFDDKFDYEIAIEPGLPVDSINIPALLLQPVVENAIDHGLFHKKEKGLLKIEFKRGIDSGIVCIVDDNGIGRKQSKLLSSHSLVKAESYGDSLIKDLVTIFNKYEKMGITIEYFDKIPPETGTRVVISIKNPLNKR